jgi:uncharacterized RDD family membrane protein YckC
MASRRLRIAAYFLDVLLLQIVQGMGSFMGAFVAAAMVSTQGLDATQIEDASSSGALVGIFFWNLVGVLINFGFLQGTTGASLGKQIVGLRVVDLKGKPLGVWKSLLRTALYTVSALPLWAGYWMALITEKRRALHDLIVGSQVVAAREGKVMRFPRPARSSRSRRKAA